MLNVCKEYLNRCIIYKQYKGLHTQMAHTHSDTSSSQCVHQIFGDLFRHTRIHKSNCNSQVECIYVWASYKRISERKYLNECTPFVYVSLWTDYFCRPINPLQISIKDCSRNCGAEICHFGPISCINIKHLRSGQLWCQ